MDNTPNDYFSTTILKDAIDDAGNRNNNPEILDLIKAQNTAITSIFAHPEIKAMEIELINLHAESKKLNEEINTTDPADTAKINQLNDQKQSVIQKIVSQQYTFITLSSTPITADKKEAIDKVFDDQLIFLNKLLILYGEIEKKSNILKSEQLKNTPIFTDTISPNILELIETNKTKKNLIVSAKNGDLEFFSKAFKQINTNTINQLSIYAHRIAAINAIFAADISGKIYPISGYVGMIQHLWLLDKKIIEAEQLAGESADKSKIITDLTAQADLAKTNFETQKTQFLTAAETEKQKLLAATELQRTQLLANVSQATKERNIAIGMGAGVAGTVTVGAAAAGIGYAVNKRSQNKALEQQEAARAKKSMEKFNRGDFKKLTLNQFLFDLGMDPLDRLKPEALKTTFIEIETRLSDKGDKTLYTKYANALYALLAESTTVTFAKELLTNMKKTFIENASAFSSEQIEVYFTLCAANKLPFPTDSRQLQSNMSNARKVLETNDKELADKIAHTGIGVFRKMGGFLFGNRTIPADLIVKASAQIKT